MRESVGGAFLLKLMVVFIVLYNSLLAIAVNYAIVFRVKNQIINLLEQYEGCQGAGSRIRQYVEGVGYYRAGGADHKGYLVTAHTISNRGTYYEVTTFIKVDFPWVRDFFRINIKGETSLIYGVFNDTTCSHI
ncbi:MAG: hypothetical protein ACOXZR_01915 [Bacilli bacterium]|jgi:hypothetical protein